MHIPTMALHLSNIPIHEQSNKVHGMLRVSGKVHDGYLLGKLSRQAVIARVNTCCLLSKHHRIAHHRICPGSYEFGSYQYWHLHVVKVMYLDYYSEGYGQVETFF